MLRGENALVAWFRQRFQTDLPHVVVGIGDDMAALNLGGGLITVTADMLLDGVHFDTAAQPLELIGRKAIACSLSDCAAMACEPRAATVSLALPRYVETADVQRLCEGMAAICEEYRCPIVGGDTTGWDGRLAIDVAMVAEPMNPARGPVLRSTAQPGDTLFVSGPLGGSLLGKHLDFTPRIELARQLALRPGLHAMMDLSDGLSMDLHRLCTASGCAAELDGPALETAVSEAAREMVRADGRPALAHALDDGEDFELLIAGSPALNVPDVGLIAIGHIRACGPHEVGRMRLLFPDGRIETVEPRGYEHLR